MSDVITLIAAAPATVTVLPPELFVSDVVAWALLVSVVLELVPVFVELRLLAFMSCWSDLPFTSLPDPSPFCPPAPFASPTAPLALASASVIVLDVPVAVKLTAVPVSSRESVA